MVRGSKSPIVQIAKGIIILERENFLHINKNKTLSLKYSVFIIFQCTSYRRRILHSR